MVCRASGKSKMASPLFKNYPSTEHFNWNIIRNLFNTPCLGKRRILQLWIRGLLMYQKFILEWVETLKYLNIADQWDTMKQKSSGTSPILSYFNKWDFLNWTIAWRVSVANTGPILGISEKSDVHKIDTVMVFIYRVTTAGFGARQKSSGLIFPALLCKASKIARKTFKSLTVRV